jgi:hypothetical protein
VIGIDYIGSDKSNYHTIMTITALLLNIGYLVRIYNTVIHEGVLTHSLIAIVV